MDLLSELACFLLGYNSLQTQSRDHRKQVIIWNTICPSLNLRSWFLAVRAWLQTKARNKKDTSSNLLLSAFSYAQLRLRWRKMGVFILPNMLIWVTFTSEVCWGMWTWTSFFFTLPTRKENFRIWQINVHSSRSQLWKYNHHYWFQNKKINAIYQCPHSHTRHSQTSKVGTNLLKISFGFFFPRLQIKAWTSRAFNELFSTHLWVFYHKSMFPYSEILKCRKQSFFPPCNLPLLLLQRQSGI